MLEVLGDEVPRERGRVPQHKAVVGRAPHDTMASVAGSSTILYVFQAGVCGRRHLRRRGSADAVHRLEEAHKIEDQSGED